MKQSDVTMAKISSRSAKSCWVQWNTLTMKRVVVVLVTAVIILMVAELQYQDIISDFGYKVKTFLSSSVTRDQHLSLVNEPGTSSHDKWIILDTSSGRCKHTLEMPLGWKLLMSKEATQFTRCNFPACEILLPDSSLEKDGAMGQNKLWKNFAYLTAISRGALYILDCDCSVSLHDALRILQFKPNREHDLMYNETLLFNPYTHFGAWATVPRTVGWKSTVNNSRLYYVRDFDKVLVKHAVGDIVQDINNTTGSRERLGIKFDPSIPAVFLGQRSFSPAVPMCSLYQQKSFWGLLFPCLSLSLRCQMLRQYVLQRLFRELDAFSGYYQLSGLPRNVDQGKDSKSVQVVDVEQLAYILDAWNCRSNRSFLDCFNDIADYLLEAKQLDARENSLMKSWIVALRKYSVVEPDRVDFPWRGVRKTGEIRVTLGSMQLRLESSSSDEEKYLTKQFIDPVRNHCKNVSQAWYERFQHQWKRPLIEDIVLLIIFNYNKFFWTNLPILETIHRPFFKHIVYCVPNVDELLNANEGNALKHIILVEGMSDSWLLFYECITTVVRMNFQGVRGYLHIGDDTLLNTWNLFNTPRDFMLMPPGIHIMSAQKVHSPLWMWWDSPRGRSPLLRTLSGLEKISRMTQEQLMALYVASGENHRISSELLLPLISAFTGTSVVSLEKFMELYPGFKQMMGLSYEQIVLLDRSVNETWVSARPVTTFSVLYDERPDVSLLRFSLDGSEDWQNPSRNEATRFLQNYYHANSMAGLLQYTGLDFIYLPQVHAEEFNVISRYFMKNGVMVELALPAIRYGIMNRSNVMNVPGKELWGLDRDSPLSHYKNSLYFLHPFKMKADLAKETHRNFFCDVYLNTLFHEVFKRRNN